MTIEIIELRKGDRFLATEQIPGTFGPAEVILIDLSLGGAKLSHPQPLRIGTRGKLAFKRGDIAASAQGVVVWSHISRAGGSSMSYVSGIKLEAVEPQYAMALNTMLRAGVLRKETDSLDKKRERMIEREQLRNSQKRVIPTSGGME
ncbi:MAG: PilZ domain-containing protein [Acidobacteriota bacterium]|nr:PilZ domain-containing protein [Acidobacteriota bacterium]